MDEKSRLEILSTFGALLVHEQMHSLQRTYPEKFRKLSSDFWGFQQANVEQDDFIRLNQVSNPDAPNPEWLIPHPTKKNQFNWVRTLLKENIELPKMGRDFTDQVFTVNEKNGKYSIVKNDDGKPVSIPVTDFKRYLDSFPIVRGIDHPNEISAYMFSNIIKSLLENKKPFEHIKPTARKNSDAFIK